MIIYIREDTLYIVYKDKVINYKIKNGINTGFIIDKEAFILEFNKIIKKEKIKIKLFGDNITVVNNGYFKYCDLVLIENIFKELGFIKIEFLDIRDLLPMDTATYIEINNSYIVLYLDKCLYLDLEYFKDIPGILNYFRNVIQNNIVLFGINKRITKLYINNKCIYYIDDYTNYITKSLLKVKK